MCCSLEPWIGRHLVRVVCVVELKFAGEIFHFPVLVSRSLTSDAILGLDFLEAALWRWLTAGSPFLNVE